MLLKLNGMITEAAKEVFYKNSCSYKFRKTHIKTPVPESLFNKVAGLSPATLLKKRLCESCNFIQKDTLAQVFSCEFCKIFKNTFFTEHL